MEALEGAEEIRHRDNGIVCNGQNMPSEMVPPDISGKGRKIDKGGQDSGAMEYHLANFDINVPTKGCTLDYG